MSITPHLREVFRRALRAKLDSWDAERDLEIAIEEAGGPEDVDGVFDMMAVLVLGAYPDVREAADTSDDTIDECLKELVKKYSKRSADVKVLGGPEQDPEGGCHCGDNCGRGPHEPCPLDEHFELHVSDTGHRECRLCGAQVHKACLWEHIEGCTDARRQIG